MKFIIHGNPISKARHRHNGRFAYDPQSKEKLAAKAELSAQISKLGSSPDRQTLLELQELASAAFFKVELTFHTSIPVSSPQNAKLWGLDFPTSKDLDNYIKFICDVANGLLYKDDRAIIEISARKCFSELPRTEINIMPKKSLPIPCDTEQFLKVFSPGELKEFLTDIKKISFSYEHDLNVLELPDKEKYTWLIDISKDVIHFSDKYSDRLRKIKTPKKVSGEGKTLC